MRFRLSVDSNQQRVLRVTITTGASGSGNGTVNYSVTANTGFTDRYADDKCATRHDPLP